MARAGFVKEVNTFVKGLITEANLLAFPEDASVVDENFQLNIDGSRQRRLGLNFENLGKAIETTYTPVTASTIAISTHVWRNVANDTGVALLVVQIGKFLYFVDFNSETLSDTVYNQGEYLELADIDEAFSIETTNMDGDLLVVTGEKHINVLSYNADTDTVTQEARNIKIRDLFGVDDNLEVNQRPSSLSEEHRYNLKNQGWSTEDLEDFKSSQGVYPSNADVDFLGRDSDNNFSPEELIKVDFGNTPASKGFFIIDPFDRGQSRGTGDSTGYGGSSSGGGSTRDTFTKFDIPT